MHRLRNRGNLSALLDSADGSLTSDGLRDYSWVADGARQRVDGVRRSGVPEAKRRVRKAGAHRATDEQNQLTSMTMKTGLPTGMTRKRIEFKYDYLRRRVQKVVKNNWNGSSGTTISNLKYVYDGHNLIAELNGSNNAVLSTYVWGLDLSGTMQGAGGVGGLLMVREGSKTYFPAYDGNGNVSALLDSADGSLDAKYEYGAFGEPLRVGGTTIAADNPFRFSTKYTDVESGLVYYGFRYYSPSLGRFLNRDPLGELGGGNLYAFVENDPVNGWDYLGMYEMVACDAVEYLLGLCDGQDFDDEEDIEELDPYEVWEKGPKPPRWRGPSRYPKAPIDRSIDIGTDFPVRNPRDPLGGGGGNEGDSSGGSGGDECKEKKEKKELPPCSEIRAKIDSGELKPNVTGQSFIEQPTVMGFLGDDRGFLDSPASVISRDYRVHGSISYGDADATIAAGVSTFGIYMTTTVGIGGMVYVSRQARPTGGGNVTRSGYEFNLNLDVRASDGLFFEFQLVPKAIQGASITVDFETGTYFGVVEHTGYPAAQVFLNGESIYNYSSDQAGKGPFDLGESNLERHIIGGYACDPSK